LVKNMECTIALGQKLNINMVWESYSTTDIPFIVEASLKEPYCHYF
jgi:hypothetical protein